MRTINIPKLDKESRDMLDYLNTNTNVTSATLADVFNQHYQNNLPEAMSTLSHLDKNALIKLKKTANEECALMIQITHDGIIYEQALKESKKENKKEKWGDRCWNLVTLILCTVITIILNFYFK